ncbi:DUF4350 domain-containing protein, partial [Aphanothece sacrum]
FIIILIIITIFVAPNNNKLNRGSTYNRNPDGYGAWYAYMEKKGTPIKRWQKPLEILSNKESITLLQIYPNNLPSALINKQKDWLKKGNKLIILGVKKSVTEANFTTLHDYKLGQIKIETKRRNKEENDTILGDKFGAIIWQEKIGKGQIIASVTPDLAANAYQDNPGNYEFLAKLVTETGNPIYVDEYLHGYKDKEVIEKEVGGNIFSYFAKTPILPIFIQVLVIIIVLIWDKNNRFGQIIKLVKPSINNSSIYIKALAGVLEKAESSDFVISTINLEEQKQLQKLLGLNDKSLNSERLIEAWGQQTGQPIKELKSIVKVAEKKSKINDASLKKWLEKWQEIREKINN